MRFYVRIVGPNDDRKLAGPFMSRQDAAAWVTSQMQFDYYLIDEADLSEQERRDARQKGAPCKPN
jgi:hypothetical protein